MSTFDFASINRILASNENSPSMSTREDPDESDRMKMDRVLESRTYFS